MNKRPENELLYIVMLAIEHLAAARDFFQSTNLLARSVFTSCLDLRLAVGQADQVNAFTGTYFYSINQVLLHKLLKAVTKSTMNLTMVFNLQSVKT